MRYGHPTDILVTFAGEPLLRTPVSSSQAGGIWNSYCLLSLVQSCSESQQNINSCIKIEGEYLISCPLLCSVSRLVGHNLWGVWPQLSSSPLPCLWCHWLLHSWDLALIWGRFMLTHQELPVAWSFLDTVINCPTHGSLDSPVREGTLYSASGLAWRLRWKSVCLQCGRPGFNPWVRKSPWRRKWRTTPAFLPGESHGSLASYSPWGHKESDMAEWLHCLSFS